ncbi:hypothetical protein [Citrobacter freundii]|uniref:hypothetical protein n=1 Tax=Citrobacter freundii TaxID=546 RepID=UPI00388D849B
MRDLILQLSKSSIYSTKPFGVSVEEIRAATEKFWPTATITKSNTPHPLSGLEKRLKIIAIAKGK